MGQIYLVRHGQASFGAADYDELSPLGIEQSKRLGRWFARSGRRVDQIVTGSLRRYRQTAAAFLQELPDALRPTGADLSDAGFDEYDHDEMVVRHRPEFADGRTLARHLAAQESPRREFQRIFMAAMYRWVDGEFDGEYRESWAGFGRRCMAALQRVAGQAGASRNLLVVTSGGPIAAICQALLEMPNRRACELNFSLVNCGVTSLLYRPGQISLTFFNNYAHLDDEGASQTITYR
ncbi:MAG TPA: histidine phosphatase family protein [Burkholderiaceae bacterium]|nr:histidine phosphatase family protein [Burkholderiaceae bacterium]